MTGTVSGFDGGERTLVGDLTAGSEVTGVMVGADWTLRNLTAGLVVWHSRRRARDREAMRIADHSVWKPGGST